MSYSLNALQGCCKGGFYRKDYRVYKGILQGVFMGYKEVMQGIQEV